jgi:hypothetical protein
LAGEVRGDTSQRKAGRPKLAGTHNRGLFAIVRHKSHAVGVERKAERYGS